jgi:geranylgeranyl pyrophosphate synthase
MQDTLNLKAFFDDSKEDIESKIKELVTDPKMLDILFGGKRLRPLLASLSFKTCTGGSEHDERYQAFLEGAVAIELAHNASLVHDDIIDGDEERRGQPAFHIKEGLDNAILIGHKMLVIGFNIMLSHGEKNAKLYMNTWDQTLNGQLCEVNFNSKDLDDTSISADSKFFQLYSNIINLKTAWLFASACKAAAFEAMVSDEMADILFQYGREVGFSYQLADDLADLEKGERIDSVVIPLLSRLEDNGMNGSVKGKLLKQKLEKNRGEIKELYLNEIKKHIHNAQTLSQSPLLPNNQYTILLQKAPTYIINAMLAEINISIE